MKRTLPHIFEEMRQALLGNRETYNWGESASDVYSATLSGLKDFSDDTLARTAERFDEATPYIEQAGYDIREIEVGLGLSPRLVAHLELRELISEAEQSQILADTKDKKMVHNILSSLFKASNARRKLKFKRFHFTRIELELSLLPTIVLKFAPNEGTSLSVPPGKP